MNAQMPVCFIGRFVDWFNWATFEWTRKHGWDCITFSTLDLPEIWARIENSSDGNTGPNTVVSKLEIFLTSIWSIRSDTIKTILNYSNTFDNNQTNDLLGRILKCILTNYYCSFGIRDGKWNRKGNYYFQDLFRFPNPHFLFKIIADVFRTILSSSVWFSCKDGAQAWNHSHSYANYVHHDQEMNRDIQV